MTNEERLEMAIETNEFLLRYRCEGVVDAGEFADLREHLRALARQWNHQDAVRKSLAGLLCDIAAVARDFDYQLGADASDEKFRDMLVEVESLVLQCWHQRPGAANLPLPFGD